jgi:hypothetical protein
VILDGPGSRRAAADRILALWGAASFALSLRMFRWT